MTQKLKSAKKPVIKKAGHHDIFFKQAYADPRFAKELFRLAFSPKEFSAFEWDSLKPEKDSSHDIRADLLFSVALKADPGKKMRIGLLLEHKSQYSKNIFNQILKYIAFAINKSLEETGEAWPMIAVVFYHGKESWKGEKSFQKGLWGRFLSKIPPSLLKDMLNYGIRLIDIHDPKVEKAINNKSFKSRGFLGALKGIWSLKAKERDLKKAISLFENWPGNKEDLALSVGDYFWSAIPGMTKKLWMEVEQYALKKGIFTKGGLMNIREYIKEEGRQEGMQQGRQEGMQQGMQQGRQKERQQVILNMLRKQTDIGFISEVTGLSKEEIKQLQNGS